MNATALVQALQHGGRLTRLGRAIGDLGRIYKTSYLMGYLDDEGYRRWILTQLNRGEALATVWPRRSSMANEASCIKPIAKGKMTD